MRMKKLLVILVVILSLAISTISTAAEPIKVYIDNSKLEMEVLPIIQDGRTLVPLRAIFEALGASVQWDQKTKTVFGERGNQKISLQIDNKIATINGKQVTLDVPAVIVEGRTMVPVRFIAESLGADVAWDNVTKSVMVSSISVPEQSMLVIDKSKQIVGPVGNSETCQFIGSLNSDKYHKPGYTHTGQKLEHNLIYFESAEHARLNGYVPCGLCF